MTRYKSWMIKIRYVFWDSDNTLVQTYRHHWHKHVETLKTLGIHLGDEWQERIYTNNGAQNWEWLTDELGLTLDKDDYLDRIDHWYFNHIGDIDIREGVLDAIAMFKNAGFRQAVVSNGRQRSVMAALTAKDMTRHFDFILCKEDYQGRKPEPAPYLAAKTKMQQITGDVIDPQSCLVIEDDPKGVESGKAAGMIVIDRPIGDDDTDGFLQTCRGYSG